jgi:hypothetical protein
MAIITLNNNSLSSVTALPAGVGGKVLQVVTATHSTEVTSSSSSFTDTGLTVNITPSSASNKVLVLIDQLIFLNGISSNDEVVGQFKILRDSTDIFLTPDLTDIRTTAEHTPGGELKLGQRLGLSILDTPSTTSAITYKTQFNKTAGNSILANKSSSEARIILMEIAG